MRRCGWGLASGLASRACADARLLARKPSTLSFEAACTLPVTWSTVHVSLARPGLRAAQAALLHAATGGVGLAATEYANWLGTKLATTTGKPGKHQALRRLQVKHQWASRDPAAFAIGAAAAVRHAVLRVQQQGALCQPAARDLGGGDVLHLELFLHLRGGLGRVLSHDTWERTGRGRASGA